MRMNAIVKQLRGWRARWLVDTPEEEILNREFAVAFSSRPGTVVLDYLIGKYFKPLEFVGAADPYRLAERNGQQLLMVDIMQRYDQGMHPLKYEPDGKEDGKAVDVRMLP